jgi:hypothetical protein
MTQSCRIQQSDQYGQTEPKQTKPAIGWLGKAGNDTKNKRQTIALPAIKQDERRIEMPYGCHEDPSESE